MVNKIYQNVEIYGTIDTPGGGGGRTYLIGKHFKYNLSCE